jgi:hypothetical protein
VAEFELKTPAKPSLDLNLKEILRAELVGESESQVTRGDVVQELRKARLALERLENAVQEGSGAGAEKFATQAVRAAVLATAWDAGGIR